MDEMLTLERIYQAAHVLKPVARKTGLIRAVNLAEDLYLKTENLQVTGAFKVRGAYFKLSKLTPEEKKLGVVACSAGNHAQGVALAAKENGIKSTIFVPSAAPISKIEAARSYGSDIRLVSGVYDDAYNAALEYLEQSSAVFVHPFEDLDVIAGQGTIGLEILEQLPSVEAVIVPIGGGGLISGVAYAVKKLNPGCKVYGVQAAGAGSMAKSLDLGEISTLSKVRTFADGIAVKSPGKMTFSFCSQYVDEIVTVTDDEIASAILTLMEKQKLVAEGAGATSVAAALSGKLPIQGKRCVSIVSGGNIDVNILSRVINRGLMTAGRLTELTIELPDMPGQLSRVSGIVSDLGANVVKVRHDPSGENSDINGCFLHLSMETKNLDHLQEIRDALSKAGYKILSD